jgi:hypothetical protein
MPPVEMPWRPIQTAPTDGSDVLGIRVDNGRQLVIRWDSVTSQWLACNTVAVRPTHWKPLPDPPVAELKEKE